MIQRRNVNSGRRNGDKAAHFELDSLRNHGLCRVDRVATIRAKASGVIGGDGGDPTRPSVVFDVHPNARTFLEGCIEDLFSGFYRNLQQSQPHHIELFAEKLTVQRILQPVAAEYTLPLTIGRGYCSFPAIKKIADRHAESGKSALIIVAASDHDTDGEMIVDAIWKSLRDDFQISDVRLVKAAITPSQVESYSLHPSCEAKATSANFKRFASLHGTDAYELEALKPNQLQDCVREAIDSVIDRGFSEGNRSGVAPAVDATAVANCRLLRQLIDRCPGGQAGA